MKSVIAVCFLFDLFVCLVFVCLLVFRGSFEKFFFIVEIFKQCP